MDSHIAYPHDHHEHRQPQHVGTHQDEDDNEEHHEKKSVLKKVKEKAKKIKDTLTKHGHGHEHDHDHHDLEEEDDEEDEEPEVHGATTIRSGAPGQGDILKVPMVRFGDTKAMHDDPILPGERAEIKNSDIKRDYLPGATQNSASTMGGSALGHEEIPGQHKVNLGRTSVMGEGLHSPQNTPASSFVEFKSNVTEPSHTFVTGKEGHLGQARVNPPVSSLGEYKSKVTDPSQTSVSGHESHFGQSRVKTPVSSYGDHKSSVTDPSQTFVTGEEGQFGQSRVNLDRPRGLEEDPYANPQAHTPSNYQTKVADPTHAGGEEIGITPILHSFDKMNIHAEDAKQSNQSSTYTQKVSSATSAIADKAISTKNAVASKLGYGGGNNEHGNDEHNISSNYMSTSTHKPLSNLSPGSHDQFSESPSNQGSSYTEKISSATTAIADKAVSAKNAVASKLGYGGENSDQHGEELKSGTGSTAPDQHGKGITTAVTEKLTPVYEKVAGAGSTVMSKIHGTGTAGKEAHRQGTTGADYSKPGQDKGVSVMSYLSEKLKPGEEDRALSEVISETLHKRKAEHSGSRPVGKVTETAEVTRRLGPDYGVENVEQSSYGKVVADSIKGAVGSLFGKADQSRTTSQQSLGSSTGTEGFSTSGSGVAERGGPGGEKRRLQGSGN